MKQKKRSCNKRTNEIQTLLTLHSEKGTQWVRVKIADKLVDLKVVHAAEQNPEDEETLKRPL